MKNYSVKKLALNGVMIALVFLTTYFTRIPTPLPGGYFNLGDAVIMLTAVFLGPFGGLIAGAIGSCLTDIIAGSMLYAPITLVVKGIEGLTVGLLMQNYNQSEGALAKIRLIFAILAGASVMTTGYFLSEAFLLGVFDEAFGLAAAVSGLIPNMIQGGLSAALGYILVLVLRKIGLDRQYR